MKEISPQSSQTKLEEGLIHTGFLDGEYEDNVSKQTALGTPGLLEMHFSGIIK